MRYLIVDTYYQSFVGDFYRQNSILANQPYRAQWRALMDQCFGTSNFFSSNLEKLGCEATEVVANCEPLQRQWAREHSVLLKEAWSHWTMERAAGFFPIPKRKASLKWMFQVLLAQVRQYHPDVLYIQDMNFTPPEFLKAARPYVQLIVGQIACQFAPGTLFKEYDLILSSLPSYVIRFREQGLKSELLRLGFEHTLIGRLTNSRDPFPVVHIGGYGPVHKERNDLLESLIERGVPLLCWGYGVDQLPNSSPIKECFRGEAWGLDMFNIRHNSRIVLSKHISSVAGSFANIMTLYEATGVGSLLMIDERADLGTLFDRGKEVVVYRSADECAERITYYLANDPEREEIARAGQARTLAEHTYFHRMEELVDIVGRHI